MQDSIAFYFITFLEGIITFISPCLLPMLPVYVTYFAGGGERTTAKTLKNAIGFVLGFTTVFVALGALSGTIGSFVREQQTIVNIVTGAIVIFFGLNFLGVFKLNIFKGTGASLGKQNLGFFSSMLFGIIFSVGWTPCVGAFLGTALMMVANQGKVTEGVLMLLSYSLGLGIPFVISAILIDKLKSAFNFIKKNYKVINSVCGSLLILIGILMASGVFNKLITVISEVTQ